MCCRHSPSHIAAKQALREELLAAVRLTVEANDICAALRQRLAFEVGFCLFVVACPFLSGMAGFNDATLTCVILYAPGGAWCSGDRCCRPRL